MNEIQEAFEKTWRDVANGYRPMTDHDYKEILRRVFYAALAWKEQQPVDPWMLFRGRPGFVYVLDVHGQGNTAVITEIDGLGMVFRIPSNRIDPARDGEVRRYNPATGKFEPAQNLGEVKG